MSVISTEPILDVRDITKVYDNGTVALRSVDIQLHKGQCHGLAGANGAGKSTLIKLISGIQKPTSGVIQWENTSVQWSKPQDAISAGIATVHQKIQTVPTLSVIENVFLHKGGLFRDPAPLLPKYNRLCELLDVDLDPYQLCGELSIGKKQLVTILRALSTGANLLILDEPTASLGRTEREALYQTIRKLQSEGVTLLYISHFVVELMALCDYITVLRNGETVLSEDRAHLDETRITEAIAGQSNLYDPDFFNKNQIDRSNTPVLEVKNLNLTGKFETLSFSVHAGEIVGIAGLLGSGRSEVLHSIFGADTNASGVVLVNGKRVKLSIAEAMQAGIALIPEDRTSQGLFVDWPIQENVSFTTLDESSLAQMLPDVSKEQAMAEEAIQKFGIVTPGSFTPVNALSGGNAQKVALARWMFHNAHVVLLDEPTVAVDIGAKVDIFKIIKQWTSEGRAVVVVNSEFEELISICDRILVLFKGEFIAEFDAQSISEPDLIAATNGILKGNAYE